MNVITKRITNSDPALVKYLFEKADMNCDIVNEEFFNDKNNILLVAYSGNVPCGFLYGYILDGINSERPQVFLYSIDVFPEFQNKGIGTALITELRDIAEKRNCIELFVLTNDSNEAAKKLYAKTGGQRENPDDVMYVYPL